MSAIPGLTSVNSDGWQDFLNDVFDDGGNEERDVVFGSHILANQFVELIWGFAGPPTKRRDRSVE